MALSVARNTWVEDQMATAAGQIEQQFKLVEEDTAARRRREARPRVEVWFKTLSLYL